MRRRTPERTPATDPEAPPVVVVDTRSTTFIVIDDAIAQFRGRSLVSGAEIVDVLLDLRSSLALEQEFEHLEAPVWAR